MFQRAHHVLQHCSIFYYPPLASNDEAIMLSRTAAEMQDLLKVCEHWSSISGLSWNAKKCYMLVREGNERPSLILNGETVRYADVNIDPQGLTDNGSIGRIEKTLERIIASQTRNSASEDRH